MAYRQGLHNRRMCISNAHCNIRLAYSALWTC